MTNRDEAAPNRHRFYSAPKIVTIMSGRLVSAATLLSVVLAPACSRSPAPTERSVPSSSNAAAMPPSAPSAEKSPDVLLDCWWIADGVQTLSILRISPSTKKAQDLAFMPAHSGTVQIGDSDYLVEFNAFPSDPSVKVRVRFQINRYTGEGNRQLLFDKEFFKGKKEDPRDFSFLSCRPHEGKPL
jgi:hypothetical protein